ncbi:conserved hypothetical protein [Talaromyces stipitatus ATCC 10500]|uniref:Uncharacterized protein n=1 Tax=Talaromyces stipitatus (strain ATCC 10500 / CBS 375.48 / QM 6759 / NRRL 1006) TaxID=441959 RepID=B8MR27_TALSN|nr:uncharacterized protein TSTA_054330 [Talaromyces stipitatus ATCC 10500]EED12922.1 conserved hypothetical protein [Talaromyces stipitatus ATCC 10500]
MPSEPGFHRVRRAKSTPSVQKRRQAAVLKPLESEVDRYHATTAASLAMAQAKNRMAHTSQKAIASSNENPAVMPSARALCRRPSLSSLTGEDIVSNPHSSSQHVDDEPEDESSPFRVPPINELQEFGLNGDLDAPSSFRRLRKSRSMLTTKSMRNLRAAGVPANGSEADSPSLRRSTDSTTGPHRSLRHSLSFFNGASHTLRKMKSHGSLSTRKQHLSKFDTEPPVPPLPLPSGLVDRPAHKPMRTTVRTMREYSPDDGVYSNGNSGKHHSKARAFSINIRKRLKRVFGIPSYADGHSPASHSSYDSDLVFESPTLSDDTLRPSLYSTKSSESIATSGSRVTSWTNSTAGNTVRTRHTTGRQSLSTIEEGYDFVDNSLPGGSEMYEFDEVGNRHGKIDSQRVYSALMRHIGETAARDGERIVSTGAVKGSPVTVERSPSIRTLRNHGSIHKVPSDLSMKTAQTSFMVERQPQSSQSHSSLRSQYYMAESPATPLRVEQTPHTSSGRSARVNVRDSKPSFFPSGSPRLKTPSPYKASMTSIREIHDEPDIYTSRLNLVENDSEKPADLSSPSIYSRTPSGAAASRDDLEDVPEEPFEPGMATIYDVQVPYKSPRRQKSPAVESGPRNSAEWRHWVMNKVDFDSPDLLSQREHHREDAECDGEAIPQEPPRSRDPSYTTTDRDVSLSQLRQIYASRQDVQEIEPKPYGQNNFSRPMSRQSMGSLRAAARLSANSRLQQSHEVEIHQFGIQRGYPADPFSNETREYPYLINNSPFNRQAIRTAREARLNRSMARRNTLKQADDQPDAKAVQFRSIRGVSNNGQRNKENHMSPSFREKDKAIGLSKLEDLPNKTGGNRMVEDFLQNRRVTRQSSFTSESVFI